MQKIIYGLVCLDWNGNEVYTSFMDDKNEAIEAAERLSGVIRVEEAHAKKDPIWTRK